MRAMSDSGADKTRIRDLVARCLEQLDERGPAVVDEVCADAPELTERVRRRLGALQKLGLASGGGAAHEAFPEQLGDFKLLRCIGGGGMGVVYLAEQRSLGRTVALKLIRPEHLYFPNARERFRREVEAVSRLRHPAVVPIYTVGESAGVPYYAMEWIDGASLEELIHVLRGRKPHELSGADLRAALEACRDARAADLQPHEPQPPREQPGSPFEATSWVEACFKLMLPVAHALEHAHRQGVVHRDLKPSNVMLTRDGRVLVVDFGLASTQGSSRLTQSGALLGSLPFTPPEIVRHGADTAGPRSDFYSLGVTLYELLSLERAFGGADAEATREAILAGRVRPLRELHPALAWDAETVCMVAMERDPARRYADATALAVDLLAVLSLRPIAARRPGLALRARRFAQRHATWTVAVAAALLLLIAVPAVWAWQQARRADDLAAGNRKLAAQVVRTRSAVMRFLEQTGNVNLANVPGAEPLRRELVAQAAALLEELFAESPSPELRNELAHATTRLATRCSELGDETAARAADARAVALFDAPGALPVATFEDRFAAANAHGNHANLSVEWQSPDAIDLLRAADRDWAALLDERRTDDTLRLRCLALAALVRAPGLPLAEARAATTKVAELLPPWTAGEKRDPNLDVMLAIAQFQLAQRCSHDDLHAESQALYRAALQRLEELDRAWPDHLGAMTLLCNARLEFGQELRVADQTDASLEQLRLARALALRLATNFPSRADFRAQVGFAGLLEGEALLDRGEAGAAKEALEAAVAAFDESLAIAPDESMARNYVSGTQRALAKARLELDDPAGAAVALARARTAAERVVADEPANAWAWSSLAEVWLLAARSPEIAPDGTGRIAAATRSIDAVATALGSAAATPDFAEIAREAVVQATWEFLEQGAAGREPARALLRRVAGLGALDLAALEASPEFDRLLQDDRFRELVEAGL